MSRRSLVYLFLIVISIALVFTGCLPLRQKETSAEEYVEVNEAYFVMQETNNAYYVEMYAGVSHLVGYIRYGITEVSGERYLYVNYDLTSTDWYLLETRLATAVTEYGTTGLPRTSGGQLDPNSYPEEFNRTWDRGDSKQSYEYLIPLGDMQGSIWFATWAKVEREENNTWSTTYAKAYHGPCSYEVPIPPVEQKEALPILDMTVDGTVTGFPSGSYGWTLSKTVDPDSFSFFTGTPATEVALYTLTATRTGPTQDATTARIEGNAEVTNNSTATTALLDYVKVNLQGYSGSWSTIEEKTLANDVLLAKSPGPDNSKDYDYFFEFNPSEYSKFRVLAETIDTKTASLNVSASATSNEMTVVEETANATATVEDVMGSIDRPGSDVTVESGYSGPWIIDGNWSITYPATLTFNGQGNPDFYALPNTATLTSGLFNVSDDATVTISIIAGQTEAPILEATPTLEVVWLRELEYLWDIEKDASPTSIELAKGQMKNIEYTIQVTRTTGESTDTYTASGTVFVQNVGDAPALGVNAKVQLQGADSDAGPFGDIESQVDLGSVTGDNLGIGESHTFNFSFDFTPPSTATHFRIKADVTSSAPDITRYSNTVGPVMPVVTTIDATATVTDKLNPPDGFTADYVLNPFDWVVSESSTLTYSVFLENESVYYGLHLLTNTATLTTSDRGIEHTDNATVTITVPHDEECVTETAWGEGSQFPGAKQWGMYFVLESDETYKEVRLIAGQHTPVGSVTVERISDNQLLVTYSLSHPWTMSEYHLHVASSLDHIPTTPGPVQNPIPGAFEYKADNLGNVTSISITTSEITGKVFIAAHAVVSDCYPYEPPDPEIDTKTLLGRYFVGYEDTYDDFDYNDFGMLFEVTEFYERVVGETEFYLTYVEMEFTPMVKDAGWTHLIRILRKLEGNYTYTISRDTVGTGSETPAAANVSGSGDLGLVLFDTSRYTQGWNNPDKDRDDSVFVQIWIEDGNTANELPTTPPRSFNVGNGDFYDLDPLMENYDPWMFVKNNDNIIRIDDVAQTSDKYNNQSNESAITVPWILVVPDLDFRPPKEGLPIVVAYPEFDDFYRTGKPANADWYNRPAGSNHHWNTLSEENLFYW